MDTWRFLNSALSDDGWYCIWAHHKTTKRIIQKFYNKKQALIAAADNLDAEGYDVYFALSTFNTGDSREATNAKNVKAFFLDLDCGKEKAEEEKGYATQGEAVVALREFCNRFSLPKPNVVNSGRGLHVYWLLTKAITAAEWKPVAMQFKQACIESDLIIDTAVPADLARVLRIPNTHNHKDAPPSPVSVLSPEINAFIPFEDFADIFADIVVPESSKPKNGLFDVPMPTLSDKAKALAGTGVTDLLAGNRSSSFKKILLKTAEGKGCEQLRLIATDQEHTEEPMWRAGLSIAKHCSDGDKAIHFISCNYADYDRQETEKKASQIGGPYLCSTFNENKSGICPDCPNWGKITTPITIGTEILESEGEVRVDKVEPLVADKLLKTEDIVIPVYPKPYFRGKNGGVYIRVPGEDDEPVDKVIYHNDLYVVRRLHDSELGEGVVMRVHLPRDGIREFLMPLTAVTSREEFRKAMSMQGVVSQNMEQIMKYTMGWVNELQTQSSADVAVHQFGWTEDQKSFIMGENEYTSKGIFVNHPSESTGQFFPAFRPKGKLSDWTEALDIFMEDDLLMHQLVICSSFGAPLMEFMPQLHGSTLNLYSKGSGHGKSTAMLTGMSVWGNPKELMLSGDDTLNFAMNRAEIYKNIPLFIDELTNANPATLSNFIYRMPEGKQRGRMSNGKNKERTRGRPWRLLAVTSANISAIEAISGNYKADPVAEVQRMMEIQAQEALGLAKGDTDSFNRVMEKNYGHAAPIFIQALLDDPDGTRKLLISIQAKVDKYCNLTKKNRFWSGWLTVAIAGGVIAKRLGLIPFDMEKVFRYTKVVVAENKEMLLDMTADPQSRIANFCAEHYGSILRIESKEDRRKVHKNGLDDLAVVKPERDPYQKIVARYETDTNLLYIMKKPFASWCAKQQLNCNEFIRELKRDPSLKAAEIQSRIGKGTSFDLGNSRVIRMHYENMQSPEEEEVLADL